MYCLGSGYAILIALILTSGCVGFSLRASGDAEASQTLHQPALQGIDEDWLVDIDEIDDEAMKGVVTLEFESTSENQNPENLKKFYHKLRLLVAHSLNKAHDSANRKQERPVNHEYIEGDVTVISVNPLVYEGHLRAPVYVRERGTRGVVPNERLKRAINDNTADSTADKSGIDVQDSFQGTPDDVNNGAGSSDGDVPPNATVWDNHRWFFIIVAIFLAISLVLLVICLSCMLCKCCQTQQQQEPIKSLQQPQLEPKQLSPDEKRPLEVQEEPLLAATTARPAMAQAPVQSEAPPPSPLDEENGWIIPMDQLTQEERQQTEVPLTRF